MYIRNITAGTYGANLDYLILDSKGIYAVPTIVVYPYTGGYNTAEAAYTAAANGDTNVKTQVISADTHQADVTGLKFGTRYILALGNVEPEENKFTAYDNISFTTGDLQVNFQVTSVNKDSIGVAADVTKNFEVEGDNSFYFAVYNDDNVMLTSQIVDADLNALRSDSGLSTTLSLEQYSLDNVSSSVTAALCYGKYSSNLTVEDIKSAQRSYLMIPNPFKIN